MVFISRIIVRLLLTKNIEVYELKEEFKDDCDWSMKYIEGDFKKLRVGTANNEALISTVSEILMSVGYQGSIQDVNYDNFKYLSQE